jgi:hypothetical protein
MAKKRSRGGRKRGRAAKQRSEAFSADVLHMAEPLLTFGHGQEVEDPRDGLMLFGPLDEGAPYGLRIGVIGTVDGIAYYKAWAQAIQGRLWDRGNPIARPPYPGFETAFRIPWRVDPVITATVDEVTLERAVRLEDRHQRVYAAVSVYADGITAAVRREETSVDLWFVVIPDVVYENCRPRSDVARELRIRSEGALGPRLGRRLRDEPSLFADDNVAAQPYHYDVDFHNQLKARLLGHALTQIVRESTIAPDGLPDATRPSRDVTDFRAAIAWNLTTAAFYKAGGRPWKIAGIRPGVCYIGLVFKQDSRHGDARHAACAAQMFLDSGDGLVFRGAVGPWYSPVEKEFHLTRGAAKSLVEMALSAYASRREDGQPPRELFIHGRAFFSDDEWAGFSEAIDGSKTKLVGVKIRTENHFRAYRLGSRPVLRGSAYVLHPKAAYLWTRGYSPRVRTYVGREVPRPLRIDILRGECPIETVLQDVLALTKVNYNTCLLADGMPVTLRFADAVGEILTAGPIPEIPGAPLPFKHYI